MTIQQAQPLPECHLCAVPTKRDTWEATGGLCTRCSDGIAETVRMLPAPGGPVDLDRERARRRASAALDLPADDPPTVFVERYVPPVPGQLELEGDEQ